MTKPIVFTKTFSAPPIDSTEILRYAGMRAHSDEIEALLKQCISETKGTFTYRVCWSIFPIEEVGDELDLSFARIKSKGLQEHLAGCGQIVLFAATVGVEIDRLVARSHALSPTKALLFNALGIERIEALCDAFEAEVRANAHREGKASRRRFSPGYSDLPLALQCDVVAALDCQRKIGLTLNQSLLLSPSKSVTAIIGIQ